MQKQEVVAGKPLLHVFKEMLEFMWVSFLGLSFVVIMPYVGYAHWQRSESLWSMLIGLAPCLLVILLCAKSFSYLARFENIFGQPDPSGGVISIALSVVNAVVVLGLWIFLVML